MIQPGNKEQKYLMERWQDQRDYYAKKARINKIWHQWLLSVSAVGAVVVPVLLNIAVIPSIIPTLISICVSIAIAVDSIYHFGDNWRVFRHTAEVLQQERTYYENGIKAYKDPATAFELFVENCEKILASEGAYYFEVHKPGETRPGSLTF